MKETPIIFQTDMIQAILEDRKDVTRRTYGLDEINKEPNKWEYQGIENCMPQNIHLFKYYGGRNESDAFLNVKCPYGGIGDRLWVRETWKIARYDYHKKVRTILYKAGGLRNIEWNNFLEKNTKFAVSNIGDLEWRSAIHMFKWVSRLNLELVNVRAELIQETTHEDAIREGCYYKYNLKTQASCKLHPEVCDTASIHKYANLWDSINAKRGYSWQFNPFVWRLEFKRV
jgi:hypothetical protein